MADLTCVRFYGEPCDPENCCGGRNSKGEPTLRARPLYQRAARVAELEAEVEQLREALEKIAAPVRPDGTYNLSRGACEQIARAALAEEADRG